jgi:hypothetical protein
MENSTAEKKELLKGQRSADSMAEKKADLMECSMVLWKADSTVSH